MREGGEIARKDRRLAIEQERRQYNAWFDVRRCAFRGLSVVCFGNYFYINAKIHESILAQLVSDLCN